MLEVMISKCINTKQKYIASLLRVRRIIRMWDTWRKYNQKRTWTGMICDHKNIEHHMLNMISYGTTCAPHHSKSCLKRLADTKIQKYQLRAMLLQNNFYVDDCMSVSDRHMKLR